MDKIDHLIYAKWVITCEDRNQVLKDHAIAVHDGKILAILPSSTAKETFQAAHQHHYDSHAVLPGLINSHTHLAMNAFRGLADDMELVEWLNNYIWPAEARWVSQEMVHDASLIAMGEMIRCGTTCFNDMYFFLDSTAKAALTAGVRAFIGMTIIDVPTQWAKTSEDYFSKCLEFYHQYKNNSMITPTLAPSGTYIVSLENLIKVKEIADQFHLRVNIHLQESASHVQESITQYNRRPLQRLNDIGLVNSRLIAIHMTQMDEEDLKIIQQHKPNIVHCPESNMKLASGICPVEKLTQMGINVALGTDGAASNNDLDMISEIRSASLLGKLATLNPKAVTAEQALKMATLHGAKALGIDHLTGSLTPGKAADFIAINLDELETQPVFNPVSAIVYASSRHQVTDTWVAGKQLMKNRQLLTLDEKELLNKAKIWGKKIKS